jgi:hypothetical protein
MKGYLLECTGQALQIGINDLVVKFYFVSFAVNFYGSDSE